MSKKVQKKTHEADHLWEAVCVVSMLVWCFKPTGIPSHETKKITNQSITFFPLDMIRVRLFGVCVCVSVWCRDHHRLFNADRLCQNESRMCVLSFYSTWSVSLAVWVLAGTNRTVWIDQRQPKSSDRLNTLSQEVLPGLAYFTSRQVLCSTAMHLLLCLRFLVGLIKRIMFQNDLCFRLPLS